MRRATSDEVAAIEACVREGCAPGQAAAMAEAVLRVALYSDRGQLEWSDLEALTRRTLPAVGEDPASWDRTAFARDVFRRHQGETVLLDWPEGQAWYDALDPDDQLVALAHVVQSAADADLASARDYAERAGRVTSGAAPGDGVLRLRGAVGRALAAAGEFQGAAEILEDVVTGWLDAGVASEASYSLSELLRIRGIARAPELVHGLEPRIRRFRAGTAHHISRAFVRLALGRAFVQAGLFERGHAELLSGHDEWRPAPSHALAARERWLHYISVRAGDEQAAEKSVESLSRFSGTAQLPLARIDGALARGEVVAPLVGELVALIPEGTEAVRTLARIAPDTSLRARMADRGVVARMAWEYRY